MKKSGQAHFVPVKVTWSVSCRLIVQAVNHSAVNEALCLVLVLNISSVAGHSMGCTAQCLMTHVVSGRQLRAGNESRVALTSNEEA